LLSVKDVFLKVLGLAMMDSKATFTLRINVVEGLGVYSDLIGKI